MRVGERIGAEGQPAEMEVDGIAKVISAAEAPFGCRHCFQMYGATQVGSIPSTNSIPSFWRRLSMPIGASGSLSE